MTAVFEIFGKIAALAVKEFLAILKDPRSRFVVIGPPIFQFFIFGYAATYDLKDVRFAVLDESRTPESRRLLARFEASPAFRQVANLASVTEITPYINRQRARLVLHFGPDFARRLRAGAPANLQVIVDGRESNVAMIALGYVQRIVAEENRIWAEGQDRGVNIPQIRLIERAWFNANLSSRWFITAALGGIISMVVVMVLTSLSVAREREFGTFEQLLVSPLRPTEILIGKAIPGMTFGLLDAGLFSFAAVQWFQVPFRGSLIAWIAAVGVFILAIVGVGLFVSSLAKTMQQGLLGAFVFMVPAVILSGFATPLENMPVWLQNATVINPVRYVVIALRRVFLEAADTSMIWPQLWPLALIACITLPLAGWFFRHRTA